MSKKKTVTPFFLCNIFINRCKYLYLYWQSHASKRQWQFDLAEVSHATTTLSVLVVYATLQQTDKILQCARKYHSDIVLTSAYMY